jgi:hypothetical protein
MAPQPSPASAPAEPSARRPLSAPPADHHFEFHRAGGLDQVVLRSGADLLALEHLDQKLWVALSCPTKGLELDARTLELLDLDRDGRVRVPEILSAIRFCAARLRDVGVLLYGADEVALSALRDDTPEGRAATGAARYVLAQLGRADAAAIGTADVADTTKVFEKTLFNGDGVVPPEAAADLEARQVVQDVLATIGGTPDRGGNEGVDRARLEAFFAEAATYLAWREKGEGSAEVMLLGERTGIAHAALQAVRAKVDDFFFRCRVAAMEPRSTTLLNGTEAGFAALAAKDLPAATADVAALPLARIEPGRALPLDEGLNPAWSPAVAALLREAVAPLLGPDVEALSPDAWAALVARFGPYEAWLAAKPGGRVEPLGPSRLRAVLAGGGKAAVEALIARDETFATDAAAIGDVVRLVHYGRDLATLLRNFLSFSDFYDPLRRAVFQAGALYLDARSCDLCVRVDDPTAHAAIASLSRCYLAYCDLRRPGGETMKIVACFTQGDSDYLRVGRNGLFYGRDGRDWDATIVKIVENPISLREAFFAPYKKFLRFVEEQVAKFAASKAAAADDRLQASAVSGADVALQQRPPAGPPAVDVGKTVGIVAALGVGIGALGTLLGAFVAGFMGLEPWWAKLVAVGGVVLLISGPSLLIAWMKLRHRTLGPILDGCGWAVNGRVTINLPLGTALTQRAALPSGARRVLEDPYVDRGARRRRRVFWLVLVLAAAALVAARVLGHWPFGPPFWHR